MQPDDAMRLDYGELLADLVFVQVEAFNAVDRRLRSELDMLLIEYLPLRVIDGTADCRVQDIARGVRITVGGASKSVDRLERRGWVERAANPNDRRSSIVRVTPRGARMLTEASAIVSDETSRRLTAALDASEIATLAAALARLRVDEGEPAADGPVE
ncbi:MarR family winged helix-turn-helix transcriptional regulator [Rathayibacter sp. CAU 1779]